MRTWDEVVKKALEVYLHRDEYAYWYGAKGEVLTDEVMDELIAEEPVFFSKYTPSQIRQFKDFARGKIGLDCSGFVGLCTGINSWSNGLWNLCYDKSSDVYQAVAGALLWMPGHVGLDIGYGFGLDFPRMGSTCELFRHKEHSRNWTGCGKLKGIDYDGSDNR